VTDILRETWTAGSTDTFPMTAPGVNGHPHTGGAPVVLLAGGAGQRMGELTTAVPKPMLTVGGRPLLWHIMRGLAVHDSSEFFVAVGHLGHSIKDYFLTFQQHATDFTVRLGRNPVVRALADLPEEGWAVTCVDTGEKSGTGARLRRMAALIPRWPVILTYGDVLADVDIGKLLAFHRSHGRLATVTAAPPPARFGNLALTGDHRVLSFEEKTGAGERGLVNIGYMVLEREVVDRYLPPDDDIMFEEEPMRALVADGEVMAYRHNGFWQPVEVVAVMTAVAELVRPGGDPVAFARRRENPLIAALFWAYLAATVAFVAWRCTVVNWGTWLGPVLLVADLFSVTMFLLYLGYARHLYEPVHRPVDVATRVVDALIATHTEPVDLIEPTVIAALRIRGVRRVLVLGNRGRDDVRAMAERCGAEYFARDATEYGKAGNLNAGLRHTDAEFVLTLDADHLARPEILERTVGYFDDPRVAFVQTPQAFYNTDSVMFRRRRGGRRPWTESDMFYESMQIAKNRWNASFYVGTNAVLRRSALDDVGGFATGTVTEDIHTAVRLHARGWRSVYLPERLAYGLEAQNVKEFYSQRRRWAVGGLVLLFRLRDSPLRKRGLTVHQRLQYLHATFGHLSGVQRLVHLVAPIVVLATLTSPVDVPYAGFTALFLGYFAFSLAITLIYARGRYHPLHNDAYHLLTIFAHVAAWVGLFRREKRYQAADKRRLRAERHWTRSAFAILTVTVTAAVGFGIWRLSQGADVGIVLAGTLWTALHALWLWSLLLYILWYERRPAPQPERLTGVAQYEWVMAFGDAERTAVAERDAVTR